MLKPNKSMHTTRIKSANKRVANSVRIDSPPGVSPQRSPPKNENE